MVDVRMNYGSMEKMEKEFRGAHKQVDESMREMKKLAKMMEDGALEGLGGDAFRNAIMQQLLPRMKVISEKMAELEKDMRGAVRATRDGIKDAKLRFQD